MNQTFIIQDLKSDKGEVQDARAVGPSASGGGTIQVDVEGTETTIIPEADHLYRCGELTSFTISNPPARGAYCIIFSSGATPTYITIPASVKGLESFTTAANTRYEINVLDSYALVKGWPLEVSA